MKHENHVDLIQKAVKNTGGVWADFGSGWGAFTLALRELGGPEIIIYSIDIDRESLESQKEEFNQMFPNSDVRYIEADFNNKLEIPKLDGILLANSLHFVEDKPTFLTKIKDYLKPEGKVVIVEYNSNKPNMWVPFPIELVKLLETLEKAGFKKTELLDKTPSEWMNEIYCAQALLN